MSEYNGNWSGRMGKGAAKLLKQQKREEAEKRNAHTKPERRRSARR